MISTLALGLAAAGLFAIAFRDTWRALTVERARLERERAATLQRFARFAIFDSAYRPSGQHKGL